MLFIKAVTAVDYTENKNKNIQGSFAKITTISKTGSKTLKNACNTNENICRRCCFDDPVNTAHRLVRKICRKAIFNLKKKCFRQIIGSCMDSNYKHARAFATYVVMIMSMRHDVKNSQILVIFV